MTMTGWTAGADKDFSSWRKYSQAELLSETTAVAPGATATVALRLRLSKGWHTYWVNPGDSGTPLHLSFKNGPGVKVARVLMPFPKRFETGPLISFGYENEVIFPIDLDINRELRPGGSAHVEFTAEWLVCEDVCIPAVQTLQMDLPVARLEDVKPTPQFNAIQKARARAPQVDPQVRRLVQSGESVSLTVPKWAGHRDFVDFFPFKGSGVTNEAPVVKSGANLLGIFMTKSNVPQVSPDRIGVLITRRKGTSRLEAIQFGDSGWKIDEQNRAEVPGGLWWMLVSALIGGLILNLMPCVFPVLSIKLLSLLKLAEAEPRAVRAQNFAYVIGVLVSFLAVAGSLSALRSAGHLIGWGFQLQSPVFLSLLVWLFFLLALNLFGVFEIGFINAGMGQRLTRSGGLWGSFFTGVLAVVVASPCTAPFMGVALGFGLAQPTPVLLAIFLALGLGLALPYLLFALFPAWVRLLPKPGMWMVRLKQVMAFPLLLTDIWLLWVLNQARGSDAVSVVLIGALALGFAVWLARSRRFLAGLVALVAVGGGLAYVYSLEHGMARVRAADDMWTPYSPALLESLHGKNVFVNMTADWCLTCKVNERLVFDDPEIIKLLKSKNINLLKGDWTERNEEITLFLNRFQRVGVPFYVLYSPRHPDGLSLPEVLTKNILKSRIAKEFP
jgi:thiol:disulfide interchange protein DsbD